MKLAKLSAPLQLYGTLSRVLRETTDKTTSAYLAARIAHKAKLLLDYPDQSITAITDGRGFAGVTYFNLSPARRHFAQLLSAAARAAGKLSVVRTLQAVV